MSLILFQSRIDSQNEQVVGRRFMYKCSHPTMRLALPRDFFTPKIHAFFLGALNWIQMEVNQNPFGGLETLSLALKRHQNQPRSV